MPRSSDQERVQKLQEKRDQLNAQLAAMEARAKQTQKKQDDRRKILLGAMVLNDIATHPELKTYLAARLPGFLVRPEDRKLFSEFMPASAPGSGLAAGTGSHHAPASGLVVGAAAAGPAGTAGHTASDLVTGPPAL